MIDSQDIGRLFDLIKALYQIDFGDISKELGLKRNDITNFKRGQKKPWPELISLISEKFPDVNLYLEQNEETSQWIIAEPSTHYDSAISDKDKIIEHLNKALERYEKIIEMQEKLLDQYSSKGEKK